ncbi:MAG: flavoprotein [Candidatus ainarchaeum sp.]|nr:flavoprotein [Candidatus ainarchaeum sp.]MDD3976122.1 flavoprotein [Candidatus ainarchaeum sp.]
MIIYVLVCAGQNILNLDKINNILKKNKVYYCISNNSYNLFNLNKFKFLKNRKIEWSNINSIPKPNLILIYPLSVNTFVKINYNILDNLLLTTYFYNNCKKLLFLNCDPILINDNINKLIKNYKNKRDNLFINYNLEKTINILEEL